jgi:AmmeMemoRadiSam system protein B
MAQHRDWASSAILKPLLIIQKEVRVLKTRRATFAGSWYPDSPDACEHEIRYFLKGCDQKTTGPKDVTGGIVPHAGWYFSGKIACQVIHRLVDTDPPDVVVVFGMHLHPKSPNYIMAEGAWETPFGAIPVHTVMAKELMAKYPFRIETPNNFTKDNTVELQLPFIKYFFPDASVLAIGLPPVESSLELARTTVKIATQLGLKMKVIGSTDLTHYGYNYGFMPKGSGPSAFKWVRDENDRRIIDAMLAMDPAEIISQALSHKNACCAGAAAGAVAAAQTLGAKRAETVAYASSHEKSPGDSFVGYVGIVFA